MVYAQFVQKNIVHNKQGIFKNKEKRMKQSSNTPVIDKNLTCLHKKFELLKKKLSENHFYESSHLVDVAHKSFDEFLIQRTFQPKDKQP